MIVFLRLASLILVQIWYDKYIFWKKKYFLLLSFILINIKNELLWFRRNIDIWRINLSIRHTFCLSSNDRFIFLLWCKRLIIQFGLFFTISLSIPFTSLSLSLYLSYLSLPPYISPSTFLSLSLLLSLFSLSFSLAYLMNVFTLVFLIHGFFSLLLSLTLFLALKAKAKRKGKLLAIAFKREYERQLYNLYLFKIEKNCVVSKKN